MESAYKCHFCQQCCGKGCIGELPGMGGFSENVNFINNCADWSVLYNELLKSDAKIFDSVLSKPLPQIRLAPITGAVENVGWQDEQSFYIDLTKACYEANIALSIGDGCPDEKLLGGIAAIKKLQSEALHGVSLSEASKSDVQNSMPRAMPKAETTTVVAAMPRAMPRAETTTVAAAMPSTMPRAETTTVAAAMPRAMPRAAVFIKPYPNPRLIERIEWSKEVAQFIGVDIDSYNILTMRNLVKLEQKTVSQLSELKKHSKMPFAIKGVFTQADVELVKQVKPEVVVISNHGGRVENRIGSTARFLQEYGKALKNYCDELWVDGGIRTKNDIITAAYFGVSQIMLGRPIITSLCKGGAAEVKKLARGLNA